MRQAVRERDLPELALTLWDPWATAIAGYFDRSSGAYVPGPKRIENRPWAPPDFMLGKRFWIHSGKVFDAERFEIVRGLWPACPILGDPAFARGAIIGTARLVGWSSELGTSRGEWLTLADRAAQVHDWWMGPYGWLVRDVERLVEPVPCGGLQKFWEPGPNVQAQLAQSRRHAA